MDTILYPPSPQNVPDSVTRPSAAFNREVVRTTIHIFLFILLYIILLAGGMALAIGLGFAGVSIILAAPKPITIIIGLGLAGIGFMVLYFLIKFVFATRRQVSDGKVEITEEQHPELFSFIRKVSEEIGTPFPAHIFLTPEVNAYVSYESNFLSLFFPAKKDLTIGLGLVNMVNLSEFKAVIAHEFGHFSQKSMRAGSYVYQANKVIYNMLYDNDAYGYLLLRWGHFHSVFAICARITTGIIKFIQYLLRQTYKSINRSYLSLARQMEFHADAVAAKLSGSNTIVHALRRIDFAESCYNNVIERYNEFLKDRHQGSNVFAHQLIAATYIARLQKLEMAQGLPVLHGAVKQYITYNKVTVEDKWSSHPSREDREKSLNALNIEGVMAEESPWLLFQDQEKLQQEMTRLLYRNVTLAKDVRTVDNSIFAKTMDGIFEKFTYPGVYKGYYDNRYITPWVLQNTYSDAAITDIEAFFEEHSNLLARINAARQDVALLQQVTDKKEGYAEFNFDGEKTKRSEAAAILTMLENYLTNTQEAVQVNDRRVYNWYLHRVEGTAMAATLTNAYSDYFIITALVPDQLQFCQELYSLVLPFFENTHTADNTARLVAELTDKTQKFITHIQKMAAKISILSTQEPYSLPDKIQDLTHKKLLYAVQGSLIDEDLNYISASVQLYYKWNQDIQFIAYKTLLRTQAEC